MSTPQVVDWDEDGDVDLLAGDIWGNVWLFSNIGTKNQPKLTNRGQLKANGQPIDAGYSAVPVIVDWNNDGKKDLVLGTDAEGVRIYLNVGTNSSPQFKDFSVIEGTNFRLGHPEVVDLNEDGRKDLLLGVDGYIFYYENQGTDANPVFNGSTKLTYWDGSAIWVFDRARVDVGDWNNDGKPDLIVGDDEGFITVFLNDGIPTAISEHRSVPNAFELYQNYPNPFGAGTGSILAQRSSPSFSGSEATTLSFNLKQSSTVRLTIFSSDGRKIIDLINNALGRGQHSIRWTAKDKSGQTLSSGVYYFVLQANGQQETRKMLFYR